MSRTTLTAAALSLVLIASACGGSDDAAPASDAVEAVTTSAPTTLAPSEAASANEFFPDVLDATASQDSDGTWTFAVTLSSPYDTPEQYADAWRVVDPDGNELGIRILGHDHASEQPFTRSHSGIEIPDGVTTVTIEGRDQANGWGGDFLEFELPA